MADVEARLREQLAGRYDVQRELGRGGMSVVFLAEDVKHHRPVAIKVLRPELTAAIGADRFLHEIEVVAHLQHPHILPLYDSGMTGGDQTAQPPNGPTAELLYYVMPYVAGESLRDRLRREKQLPVADAVQIARDVADALAFAHSHGVVHRDVKPENILLIAGHAVVADFGIARALDAAGGRRLTGTGIVLGTPTYMSPEQAGGGDVDGRSDVYALGCVLYEMLAGLPPFTGPTVHRLLAQHLTDDPSPVTAARPAVPAPIAAALRRALAKIPADRYATAHQFVEALAGADTAAGSPTPGAETAARRRPSARGVGVAALAAVLVAATLFVWSRLRAAPGSVTPSAEAIAVLPFVPVNPDTALERLGRELAVTLSSNLDGVGEIRTVDALTMLAHVPDAGLPSPADEAALARRLGARALLHGTLVRVGGGVRVDAVLSDAEGLAPLARAGVTGPSTDLVGLSDSTTFAILSQIWRRGEPPAPNLAAITTHSLDALRAYLEGERALARADFEVAVRAFDRAFAADSTFWFAYWRSLYPRVYEGSRPDSAVLAGIVEHRADFPPMDRLLIESRLADSLSGELAILQDATTRFPTYWPAKYALADALVHRAPLLGSTFQEARAALGRVLELNPQFFPAWDHLFWYGAYLKDSALAAHAFAALEELAASGSFRMTQDRVRYYETVLSVARHDGRFTRERLAAAADFLLTASQVAPIYLGYGLLDFRFPQAQIELNQEVLARDPPRGLAGAMWFGLGLSWATRGAWAEALAAIRQWLRLTDLREAPVVAYGLAVIGVRFGSVDPTTAAALRPAGPSVAESAEARAELAWLDGILAHAREDRAGLAAAQQAVRIAGGRFSDLLEESLAAFALDLEGRAADAARRLTSLEWESAEAQRHHQYARPHPFFTSVNRLTAARQLLAAGDTAQAGRLLTWTDAVLWNAHGFMDPLLAVFEPLAVFERARIAAAQSRTSEAVWLYRRFLEQYDRPEGGWAARVEEAVGAVSR